MSAGCIVILSTGKPQMASNNFVCRPSEKLCSCLMLLQLIFNCGETLMENGNNLLPPLIFFSCTWLSEMFSVPLTHINESAVQVKGPDNLSFYSFLVTNYCDEGRSNESKTHFQRSERLHCKCQAERKLQLGRGNCSSGALGF